MVDHTFLSCKCWPQLNQDQKRDVKGKSVYFGGRRVIEQNITIIYIFLVSRNILITVGRIFSLKVKLAYAKLLLLQHRVVTFQRLNANINVVSSNVAVGLARKVNVIAACKRKGARCNSLNHRAKEFASSESE